MQRVRIAWLGAFLALFASAQAAEEDRACAVPVDWAISIEGTSETGATGNRTSAIGPLTITYSRVGGKYWAKYADGTISWGEVGWIAGIYVTSQHSGHGTLQYTWDQTKSYDPCRVGAEWVNYDPARPSYNGEGIYNALNGNQGVAIAGSYPPGLALTNWVKAKAGAKGGAFGDWQIAIVNDGYFPELQWYKQPLPGASCSLPFLPPGNNLADFHPGVIYGTPQGKIDSGFVEDGGGDGDGGGEGFPWQDFLSFAPDAQHVTAFNAQLDRLKNWWPQPLINRITQGFSSATQAGNTELSFVYAGYPLTLDFAMMDPFWKVFRLILAGLGCLAYFKHMTNKVEDAVSGSTSTE
jgi:hypothetical protein